MKTALIFIVFAFLFVKTKAQTSADSIRELIAEIYDSYTEESELELDFNTFTEDLIQLSESPLNLNSAGREDIRKFVFLTESQQENLMYYVYRSGGMDNFYELQLVEGIDMTDIRRMLPFVKLEKTAQEQWPTFHEILKFGHHEIQIRVDHIPEDRAGFINSAYTGEDYYARFGYRYHFKDKIYWGFTGEKDTGEPFIRDDWHGFDFNSAYLQIKRSGRIENLILGDYKVNFAQGLLINQGGMGSGYLSLSGMINSNTGFRKSNAVNESDFCRGIAVSVNIRKFQLHGFVSLKKADGNYEDGILQSIHKTGYHRTLSEIAEKNNLYNFTTGMHVLYRRNNWEAGFSCLFFSFSDSIRSPVRPYNLFAFRGSHEFFTGLNFRMRAGKFNLFGEAGINADLSTAILAGFNISPVSFATFGLSGRYYSRSFNNTYSSAISAGSGINNEAGIFTGIELIPFRKWKIALNYDIYSFQWLRYQADFPSVGYSLRCNVNYQQRSNRSFSWRFRSGFSQVNESEESAYMNSISNLYKQSVRFQFKQTNGLCTFSSNAELNRTFQSEDNFGMAFWQDIGIAKQGFPLQADLRFMIFDIPDYNNRVYAFEKDVLNAFSIPAINSTGTKMYILLKMAFGSGLMAMLKISHAIYADGRSETGSGNDLIAGNKKTEIKCLLNWKIPFF